MATIDNTLRGKIIKFNVYPSTLITSDFTNVTLLGIGGYQLAAGFINPAEMHAMVYPTLPTGTPNNYQAYDYAFIQLANGVTTVLGIPWIDADSVTVASGITATVTLTNLSIEDVERLRLALLSNDITDFTLTTT